MANYTIRDLERLSGIKAHTIRIWEKRYNIIHPERTSTNIRSYCDEDLKKLLNVSILNKNGHKISKIAELKSEEIKRLVSDLKNLPMNESVQVEALTILMIDLNEIGFEKALTNAIMQHGFEQTMVKIIFPFFERVGVMWQTGTITPAQEHFVSNIIRQKMFVAIDGQLVEKSKNSKNFLLFLPENEMHELGLLFANYIIRRRGHEVTYLGQCVPMQDLVDIAKKKRCDYLFTCITSSISDCEILNYLNKLSDNFGKLDILITGKNIEPQQSNLPSSIKYMDHPDKLIQFLDEMNH